MISRLFRLAAMATLGFGCGHGDAPDAAARAPTPDAAAQAPDPARLPAVEPPAQPQQGRQGLTVSVEPGAQNGPSVTVTGDPGSTFRGELKIYAVWVGPDGGAEVRPWRAAGALTSTCPSSSPTVQQIGGYRGELAAGATHTEELPGVVAQFCRGDRVDGYDRLPGRYRLRVTCQPEGGAAFDLWSMPFTWPTPAR